MMTRPRLILTITLLVGAIGLSSSTDAADRNPNTDWLRDARVGVFMHLLPGDAEGLKRVDQFDVDALVAQLEEVGAKYFVLTLGQNSGFMNSPNPTYDRITGYQPGERCSTRDLPLDLYRALHPKGIQLMLYLPCQVPNRDVRAQQAFGLTQGPKDQPIDVAFAKKWAEVIHDWSSRYGDKVAGWWFDGGYEWIGFNNEIATIYADAVKRCNPKAIVTFNPGVRLIRWSEAEDYTAGELNEPFETVPNGRWVDGSQWHALTYLGSSWSKRDTRYPADRWADWVRSVVTKGGAVTLDAGPNWDPRQGPIGAISEDQMAQLRSIHVAVNTATTTTGSYVDPAQLDCPWPKHSFYKQPWRGFLEVRSGEAFLRGIGVNYHSPGNDEVAIRLLAETGFRAYRYEIGWGSVAWDESQVGGHEKHLKVLQLMRQYDGRPTLLLNAHHGVPCPIRFFERTLAADAAKGATSIQLTDTEDLVPGRSGINGLDHYWAAQVLITAVDSATGQCQLSKALPWDLKADKPVRMATLKYAPFYPVNTPEFEETAAGWVKYALMVCDLAAEAGHDEFDVEIWNELSFGSNFVHIDHYYEKGKPPYAGKRADFLNPGGSSWELSRRTIEAVNAKYPKARCIWGWSNTTFYHCAVENLPPGTDGQSYHPYGTGLRCLPQAETHKDRPELNLEGYTPKLDIRMSEGWAHTFIQTEGLMRLLNPEARENTPEGTTRFHHYITEHGVVPAECGVTDADEAWRVKTYCALRSFCLWMNKGIDVLHYFQAADKPAGMGLLPPDINQLPVDVRWNDVATPPMRAIRAMCDVFAGAEPVENPVHLDVDVEPIGATGQIFAGDGDHPPLNHQDVFAFLPFQTNARRLVIPVYVISYDVTQRMPEEMYRLTIRGLDGEARTVWLIDPITGGREQLQPTADLTSLRVDVKVADYPRLLVVQW